MKVSEIRPFTTYLGASGSQRKVKSIQMDVDGGFIFFWRAVRLTRAMAAAGEGRAGFNSIGEFADWAVAVTDTLSADLEHYVRPLPPDDSASDNSDS